VIDLPSNDTMMQYFEWYLPSDSTLWNKLTKEAKHLENIGLTFMVTSSLQGSRRKRRCRLWSI